MTNSAQSRVETIIDSSINPTVIAQAITTYIHGLTEMAFPADLEKTLHIHGDIATLRNSFNERAKQITTVTQEIILQINTRARELNDPIYKTLQTKDKALWQVSEQDNILFGVLVCVDKGISGESMGIDISNVGRVLAGDIEFAYIPSKQSFYPMASALIKRLIHYGRQGKRTLVEPLIEHTSCGRRGQILANEEAHGDIPQLGYIFEHIDALAKEFPQEKDCDAKLKAIHTLWWMLPRNGASVITPDKGLYTGTIQKIAQRQALTQLKKDITIISPIETYEKETGNLYAGLDALPVLTDPRVLRAGGYTPHILSELSKDKTIFSLANHADLIYERIEQHAKIRCGMSTFHDLQHHWLESLTNLVSITQTLWQLYANHDTAVESMINEYFMAWSHRPIQIDSAIDRRIIHHVFHIIAYAFLLDTLKNGHEPGVKHIEHYLATGDHEIGSKPLIALGQGDWIDQVRAKCLQDTRFSSIQAQDMTGLRSPSS